MRVDVLVIWVNFWIKCLISLMGYMVIYNYIRLYGLMVGILGLMLML